MTPGVSRGKEGIRLGQRGSSTTPFDSAGCEDPQNRLLGEVGKGHLIAFNVLEFGRLKMGVASIGGAKKVLGAIGKNTLPKGISLGRVRLRLSERSSTNWRRCWRGPMP